MGYQIKRKLLIGQVLSVFIAYKYLLRDQNVTTAYFTDSILVPLTCGCIGIVKAIKKPKLILEYFKQGFVCNLLFYIFVYGQTKGTNLISTDFTLLIASLSYLFSIFFKWFLSDSFVLNIYHCIAYFLSFTICVLTILSNIKSDYGRLLYDSFFDLTSVHAFIVYTLFTNVICNEIGLSGFLSYSIFTVFFSLLHCLLRVSFEDFINEILNYKKDLDRCLLYYGVSLICYICSIVYLQMCGLVAYNLLNVTNLLIFLIYENKQSIVLYLAYLLFVYSINLI